MESRSPGVLTVSDDLGSHHSSPNTPSGKAGESCGRGSKGTHPAGSVTLASPLCLPACLSCHPATS